jgi:hypothetical protein
MLLRATLIAAAIALLSFAALAHADTASRSESNKSLQTSNVTLADWCPSIRLRANTFTPEVIAMLAHGLCPVHT